MGPCRWLKSTTATPRIKSVLEIVEAEAEEGPGTGAGAGADGEGSCKLLRIEGPDTGLGGDGGEGMGSPSSRAITPFINVSWPDMLPGQDVRNDDCCKG